MAEALRQTAPAALPADAVRDTTPDTSKRRQILDGARQVFLSQGFDGASMNDVARVANVSKGTLYVYFPSKEALFEAFIREEKRQQAEQICRIDAEDIAFGAVLQRFARNFLTVLTRPEALAHMRTVLGIASKNPAIGRAYYEAGPRHGIAYIAGQIRRQQEAGVLRVEDAEEAAAVFLDLTKSGLFGKLLFCPDLATNAEEIDRHAERATRLFLQLYAV